MQVVSAEGFGAREARLGQSALRFEDPREQEEVAPVRKLVDELAGERLGPRQLTVMTRTATHEQIRARMSGLHSPPRPEVVEQLPETGDSLGRQVDEVQVVHASAQSTLPGFRRPFGSSACFTDFISAISVAVRE